VAFGKDWIFPLEFVGHGGGYVPATIGVC
jgi:hypothetical protein